MKSFKKLGGAKKFKAAGSFCAQYGKKWCNNKTWKKDARKCCPTTCGVATVKKEIAQCAPQKMVMKPNNKNGCNGNWDWSMCGCTVHKISEKPKVSQPKLQTPKVNPKTGTTHWDIKPLPLQSAAIFVKTVAYTEKRTDINILKKKLNVPSGKGYCEKLVNSMTQVSNQRLCKGVNKNVGFYYRVTFPVGTEGLTYSFKTPVDFGLGGMVYLDGKKIKQDLSDIWQGGKSTKLDFTAKLTKGNHVLELFGSEKCCDGTTRWTFKVNSGKWMDVTT
jgi:hypothetical protein